MAKEMTSRIIAVVACISVAGLSGSCAKMLGIEKDPQEKQFEHRPHVLEGINCLECHAGIQDAGETGPLHLPTTQQCVDCHKDPHDPNTCLDCHGRALTRNAIEMARKHLLFSHAAHSEAGAGDCVRCHVDVRYEEAALRPSMATCFSCHEHAGQWDIRDCDSCHVELASEGDPPESHVVHDGDFLREHGVQAAAQADLCTTCHTQRQCAACHGVTVPTIPSRLAFDSPMRQSMHRANFFSVHDMQAAADPGMCVICHSELFCVDCHTREGVAGADAAGGNPHPPGWSGPPGTANDHGPAARLDPVECASCHGGAGEMLCVGCHRVGGPGGNPHPDNFNSRLDMVNDLPCRLCHMGGQ